MRSQYCFLFCRNIAYDGAGSYGKLCMVYFTGITRLFRHL